MIILVITVCSGVSVIMSCNLAVQNDANHYQMLNENLTSFPFKKRERLSNVLARTKSLSLDRSDGLIERCSVACGCC